MARLSTSQNEQIIMISIITKLRRACAHHRIYLYGAGMYGRMLYAFLQEQNIGHIEKFIVSKSDGQRVVLGGEVITLEEYDAQRTLDGESAEEDLIIVAVSEKHSVEIVKQLENRKQYHYITLTQKELDVIDSRTLFDCIVPQKNIAVLMYHRIIDSNYNFWKLNVSPQTFEKHIKYISENYKVLKLEEEWSNIVEAGEKYVVITFDDGYVDNYRFALPILEKYHVPATVFVSTDLIDMDEMYWWDELEKIFIIDKYTGEFELDGIPYKVTDSSGRENACLTIRNRMKDMNPVERRNSMRELRTKLGLEQPGTCELRCVNTQELVRMAESPYVTIGGHTKSHLSMGDIHSKELLRSEIEGSLGILERKIGKKVDVFAYPFGAAGDRCDAADQILSECGIKKTMLVRNGNVNVEDKMYNIPRHMVYEGEDIEKKMNRIWGLYG
ncbi:MAG: polysaccharide deacetylase family protein [Lachnospiraceae bacterium]|nr:polysaccharide deacetylase family protein [Lachnospiraceae bacterium]